MKHNECELGMVWVIAGGNCLSSRNTLKRHLINLNRDGCGGGEDEEQAAKIHSL